MWLSDKSVNRPVAVTVFALIPFIIGLYSLSQLVIDLFPEINFPIAVVITDYKGVAPQEIEQLLTKPLRSRFPLWKELPKSPPTVMRGVP